VSERVSDVLRERRAGEARLAKAVTRAYAEGFKAGQELMRERAALILDTEDGRFNGAHKAVRTIPLEGD
jgi:flagellar biosynthesis/type III secretory pathway protein FliH